MKCTFSDQHVYIVNRSGDFRLYQPFIKGYVSEDITEDTMNNVLHIADKTEIVTTEDM